ncbi:hypothetical protein INP81_17555 [Comamonas thiooxydans]|uniref:hypothetical protein n=1 Tax=Comamonas thiooxydans TaxID=363952 RepID=UPI0018A5C6D3|nr:hypothetical protein [Comamonas thiooxydans]QOQ81140.1 hypothetical protein INP81_17555 [Comamonas thiooxydans]
MTTPTTQSAHVCTSKQFERNLIWLKCAAEDRKSFELLRKKSATLRPGPYFDALVNACTALEYSIKSDEKHAIDSGLLLHLGVDRAAEIACQLWEKAFRARHFPNGGPTC